MSNKQYVFQSTWHIDAPLLVVWETLTAQPFSWSEWWPQLNNIQNLKITPQLEGTSFSCTWQAPIGYKLRSGVIVGMLSSPKSVTLHTQGDLEGTIMCHLSEHDGLAQINVDWQVETTKTWMNRLAFLLRPFFIWSHHAVMRGGERGLNEYIRKNPA